MRDNYHINSHTARHYINICTSRSSAGEGARNEDEFPVRISQQHISTAESALLRARGVAPEGEAGKDQQGGRVETFPDVKMKGYVFNFSV